MATLNRSVIRSLVRDGLNEQAATVLTDTELNAIIDDGCRDTAVKGLCREVTQTLTLTEGVKIYPEPTGSGVPCRTLYVEHDGLGLICIPPQAVGFVAGNLSVAIGTPQFWFPWGEMIVLEPAPNAAAVSATTKLHSACYPAAALATDATVPDLPAEFHECVYLYTLAFCALKLRRWGDAAMAYNRYIADVQRKRFEYVFKVPDAKAAREIPDNVVMDFRP